MEIFDLTPNVRMLMLDNPGQVYLIRRGGAVILIDTGITGQAGLIEAGLADWGLTTAAVSDVVLTHWHPDHVGSAAEIATWPNARIWASSVDAPIIRGERPGVFARLTQAEEAFLTDVVGPVPDARPSRVDREIEGDEDIPEIGARIIATRGHTEGSIAIYFPEEKALFTGDIATHLDGHVFLGPFNVDRDVARSAFRSLGNGVRDLDLVCFGHGSPLVGHDTSKFADAAHADPTPDPLG